MNVVRPSFLVVAAVALLLVACSQTAEVDLEGSASLAASGDRYVVVLKEQAAPGAHAANQARAARVANDHGVLLRHTFGTALVGFSGSVPAGRLTALARDPRVAWIEPEEVQHTLVQTLPTGIERIGTNLNPTVGGGVSIGLDVAVLDTGIRKDHPDLNVAGGRNFANGGPDNWGDGNGHGTHVAGTIGAIDNGIGVVGVAPGVRLWSVRVCGNSGFCMSGDIIAGIDWVAQQKASGARNFAAANFSISSADSNDACTSPANATHKAICGLVDTGVVFVMAAGNEGRLKTPYPVAFSVSAIADFDGRPGGAADPTCRSDTDDTLANFSNFGGTISIAAPGVCILSTWNDGGYATISGTSMAAPHVTGAVALYLHANRDSEGKIDVPTDADGAAAVKDAIIAASLPQGTDANACSYDGVFRDGDLRFGGPLLLVNADAFGGVCGTSDAGDGGSNGDDGNGDGGNGVGEGPSASFTYSCGNSSTCTFTDTSTAGDGVIEDWDWVFSGSKSGSSSAQGPHEVVFLSAGSHVVTLTVMDANGKDDVAKRTITCSDHPVRGLRCK
jgi:subtilisin